MSQRFLQRSSLPPATYRPRLAGLLIAACVSGWGTSLPWAASDDVEPAAEEENGPAASPAVGADPHPGLTRLSPREKVWLDIDQRRVIVGGEIALSRGQIEFFACPRGTKEHESVVAVDASARLVHTALLAVGLQPGEPVQFAPEYRAARGPVVRIDARWTDADGVVREVRAQDWVRDTRTGRAMDTVWVFAGSSFWKDETTGQEYYQADGGDLVCVSNFPTAMLDLPISSSQSNEALLFEVFDGRVPERGTPVELVFSAEPDGQDAAAPRADDDAEQAASP
jgi:hypothetical protein